MHLFVSQLSPSYLEVQPFVSPFWRIISIPLLNDPFSPATSIVGRVIMPTFRRRWSIRHVHSMTTNLHGANRTPDTLCFDNWFPEQDQFGMRLTCFQVAHITYYLGRGLRHVMHQGGGTRPSSKSKEEVLGFSKITQHGRSCAQLKTFLAWEELQFFAGAPKECTSNAYSNLDTKPQRSMRGGHGSCDGVWSTPSSEIPLWKAPKVVSK